MQEKTYFETMLPNLNSQTNPSVEWWMESVATYFNNNPEIGMVDFEKQLGTITESMVGKLTPEQNKEASGLVIARFILYFLAFSVRNQIDIEKQMAIIMQKIYQRDKN